MIPAWLDRSVRRSGSPYLPSGMSYKSGFEALNVPSTVARPPVHQEQLEIHFIAGAVAVAVHILSAVTTSRRPPDG
jgi:hypothetical protein